MNKPDPQFLYTVLRAIGEVLAMMDLPGLQEDVATYRREQGETWGQEQRDKVDEAEAFLAAIRPVWDYLKDHRTEVGLDIKLYVDVAKEPEEQS